MIRPDFSVPYRETNIGDVLGNPAEDSTERRMYWPAMLAMLPPTAARVLDFGCGNGSYTRDLTDRYPSATIVGVDAVAEQLPEGSERCQFFAWDGKSQLEVSDLFDLIIAKMVLHYLSDDDIRRFTTHILEALAPGGVISFSVPHPYNSGRHNLDKRTEWDRRHRTGLIHREIGNTGITAAMYHRDITTWIKLLWDKLNERERYTVALDEVENDSGELKRLIVTHVPCANDQILDEIHEQMHAHRPPTEATSVLVDPTTPAGREVLYGDLSAYPKRPLP